MDLREEIVKLGPWHLNVQVTQDISTDAFLEAPEGTYPKGLGKVTFIDPRANFERQMKALFPGGLAGRSVIDCACNCGGYVFWCKEMGAGRCLGFDVRDIWIKQANFLLEHREGPSDDVAFVEANLYDIPGMNLEPFDICIFKGIFYHLPDPITGLKIAADLTKDFILVNTAVKTGYPDGLLVLDEEDREAVMNGVHGLNWYPSSPHVIARVLRWLGFQDIRCTAWTEGNRQYQVQGHGRTELVASRRKGAFDSAPPKMFLDLDL